jgi:hypothetical protein
MIANKLKKISGIIRIRISKPNFESKLFTTEYIYTGCVCLNSANSNYIYTHYIPGVIDANFITYNEMYTKFNNKEIDWEQTNKIELKKMSKQWDYICFEYEGSSNFINFPKINKIGSKTNFAGLIFDTINLSLENNKFSLVSNFTEENEYNIYGLNENLDNINTKINIIQTEKINLIHDELPCQNYYLCEKNNLYSGSLIYTVKENLGNYKLEILGITSNDYEEYGRIIPLEYLEYNDSLIKIECNQFIFELDDIINIPIIKKTEYPILTLNYGNILKEKDVIIQINNLQIFNMNIFNSKLSIYQTIDEYLTYETQINSICKLIIIRKKKIIELEININTFKLLLKNEIYLNVYDPYLIDNSMKFSTDLCDYILENEIYNQDILKYLHNFNYKICSY